MPIALNSHASGRHFLQIPGPTNVPDAVLNAMRQPTIDHRGPEFAYLGKRCISGMQAVFGTKHPVIIYPGSGTGAWEAALVNTLSAGDAVLMYETGHFASLWEKLAKKLGIKPEFLRAKNDADHWRTSVDASQIQARLTADTAHTIKAVCVVHNETSTGVTSNIAAVRAAIDAAKHPALLMVDTISGLGSVDYQHDAWGVDVTISGSQKGLMLPPGLGFNAISPKAIEASKIANLPRAYWAWDEIIESNKGGYWPSTPATGLLYGLDAALDMLEAETLPAVFARHHRHAEATRACVRAWGMEILCTDAAVYSDILTAVVMPTQPDGTRYNADALRKCAHTHYNLSLGTGLGRLAGWVFRIGHLGDFNDLTLMGTLSGVEMAFMRQGVPLAGSGVAAAMAVLAK
jgi:alanine-glyoxylate transaminase / serine-glyoxylate transaminase / serine-pyruvate transaminase